MAPLPIIGMHFWWDRERLWVLAIKRYFKRFYMISVRYIIFIVLYNY